MKQIAIINIAAAIIINEYNEMLLVRKQNSSFFMQAGGKLEIDETAKAALIRELQEELHLTIKPEQLTYLGEYQAPAANEKDHQVSAHLFNLNLTKITLQPNAELAEVGWYSVEQAKKLILAPLTEVIILPLVANFK